MLTPVESTIQAGPATAAPLKPSAEPQSAPLELRPPPHSAAAGMEELAEAFDRVAIRCWVGTEFDGHRFVGSTFPQRVENGWFVATVTKLAGGWRVERRTDQGAAFRDATFDDPFELRWHTRDDGTTVCERVETEFATIDLELDGAMEQGRVMGCGHYGDLDGSTTWSVPLVATPCTITVRGLDADAELPLMHPVQGEVQVPALTVGQRYQATVQVEPAQRPVKNPDSELEGAQKERDYYVRERDIAQRLAANHPEGSAAAVLFSKFVEHREDLIGNSDDRISNALDRLEVEEGTMSQIEAMRRSIEKLNEKLEAMGMDTVNPPPLPEVQ